MCFLNSKHQCTEADVENDNQDSKQESTCGPEEDILDYQACHTHGVVFSPLMINIRSNRETANPLLKIEPINLEIFAFPGPNIFNDNYFKVISSLVSVCILAYIQILLLF